MTVTTIYQCDRCGARPRQDETSSYDRARRG